MAELKDSPDLAALSAAKPKPQPEYRYQEYRGRSGAAPSPRPLVGPRKFTSLQNLVLSGD